MPGDYWLKCKISSGPFPSEFVVLGSSSHGPFSLFAPKELVRVETDIPHGGEAEGFLRVRVLGSTGDLRLVGLPVTPLENSQTITVQSDQLVAA